MKLTEKLKDLHEVKGGTEPTASIGIVKGLKDGAWGKSNQAQLQAVNEMKKLAEMDDDEANDFMSYMDNASSSYKGNIEKASDKKDEGVSDDYKQILNRPENAKKVKQLAKTNE